MSDHLSFIDEYASKMTAAAVKEPKIVRQVPKVIEQPIQESYEEDDEFLTENGWGFRRGMWTDPITKDRLCYETAYAVQKERYRLDEAIEILEQKLAKKAQFFDNKIREAAEIIKSQAEQLEENDEYIARLDETVLRLKEKPKAKRIPAPERIVERTEPAKKPTIPKAVKPAPEPVKTPSLTTRDRAAEILGDYDDNILYDPSMQEMAISQANSKFVVPEQPVYVEPTVIPTATEDMTEEQRMDIEARKLEMEAFQTTGNSGGISESAFTSDSGSSGGSPMKYTMSPVNQSMHDAVSGWI